MGALTHKEREALEDVFLSLKTHTKVDHCKDFLHKTGCMIQKMFRYGHIYGKKLYFSVIKIIKKSFVLKYTNSGE